MNRASKVFVAGGRGMVGSAIRRALAERGFNDVEAPSRDELDLADQAAVSDWLYGQKPDYVFLAAARVGGIYANNAFPADFIYDNLVIETNVIHSAWMCGVRKLCFLGSSCIYPRNAPQPMKEEDLLTGTLEPTNEWYAIAKIAGVKLCQAYRRQHGFDAISVMPTNLYGPGDNFHPVNSHVVPALIRRFHEAREEGSSEVVIWGTGTPRREFMHVADFADACLFLMEKFSGEQLINVGIGDDIAILDLAKKIAKVVGYKGKIRTDPEKADGAPRKLLDVSRLHDLGWHASIGLEEGLHATYQWFLDNQVRARL